MNELELYAQIKNGRVVNTHLGDPTGLFDSSIKWVKVDNDTVIGDIVISEENDVTITGKERVSLNVELQLTLDNLNKIYRDKMGMVVREYDSYEIDTWFIQVHEAQQVLAGNVEEAVFLSELSKERHVDLTILAYKVLEQNIAFRKLVGNITGKRQYLEDMVKGATTIGRLNQVRRLIKEWQHERSY